MYKSRLEFKMLKSWSRPVFEWTKSQGVDRVLLSEGNKSIDLQALIFQ